MESAIVLTNDEVRTILAEHYGVEIKDVARMQYSYVIKNVKGEHLINEHEEAQ